MSRKKLVLVVDDEPAMRQNIVELLQSQGYDYAEAVDGEETLDIVKSLVPDVILLDINLPKKDGLTLLKEIQELFPKLPVIIFTAYGTSERAIEAMKSGAFDYLEKPFELDEFIITINRALEFAGLVGEVNQLREQVSEQGTFTATDEIIGRSPAMQEIFKLIGKISLSDATVLIQGESGTGKELIADAIQRHSLRREKPFVRVNCGALSETLLESEIFGHEKGSFTGAAVQKLGRFELADTGTVFLDEINNMPLSLQVKLLRILQKQPFYRVGGQMPINVDVRIIAASNSDIEQDVRDGKLREDLFYRLNVVRINVPALRNRKEDIPILVDHFIKKHSGTRKFTIADDTMKKLVEYDWPGNIRELENSIQRAIVVSRKDVITIENLPIPKIENSKTEENESFKWHNLFNEILVHNKSFKDIISEVEKDLIIEALNKTAFNRSHAAKLLKIHRRLLYTKMRDYNINVDKH